MTRQWDLRWHCEVTTLASLPRARDDLHEPCMAGPAWLRRLRWLVSRRTRSDCCWYHSVDWHSVIKTAIPIARQAEASGIQPEDLALAIDSAMCGGLAGDELEAVRDLFIPGGAIEVNDDDPRDRRLQEGNHRVTAMRDARVPDRHPPLGADRGQRRLPVSKPGRYLAVMRNVGFPLDDPSRP